MEHRAASVLLLVLCAVIIIITTEGRVPNCCLVTSDMIHPEILNSAQRYDIQSDAGPCPLKALILYVKKKRICLDPKLQKVVKMGLKKRNKQKKKQKKQ